MNAAKPKATISLFQYALVVLEQQPKRPNQLANGLILTIIMYATMSYTFYTLTLKLSSRLIQNPNLMHFDFHFDLRQRNKNLHNQKL
ncbi:hypothetical protein [Orrella sp. 11846]|uniref:hypothetical protein n=1 Tax=Orrella sp. 11846 TaxID=3409913 RepID=UPI003B5A9F70